MFPIDLGSIADWVGAMWALGSGRFCPRMEVERSNQQKNVGSRREKGSG